MRSRSLLSAFAALALAACAGAISVSPQAIAPEPGWTPVAASTRSVGLGLPGGARLDEGVTFAGGIELIAQATSPLHSLSDLKLTGSGFVTVSDAGDLFEGALVLDGRGRLTSVRDLRVHRLTLADGQPIVRKEDGDAEGLLVDADGNVLVSFERDHRIWNYGPYQRPAERPTAVARPDFAFPLNDGMEGIAVGPRGGWRVAGESGGVWDCARAGCAVVTAPPETPLADGEFRVTGMDRDPSGDGWFVVQRSYRPPLDARARVRRMDASGALGPVLVELKLPGTTDNFEGIAAIARDGGARLYILSDDNNNDAQRTLLLAFDVRPAR